VDGDFDNRPKWLKQLVKVMFRLCRKTTNKDGTTLDIISTHIVLGLRSSHRAKAIRTTSLVLGNHVGNGSNFILIVVLMSL